MHTAHYIAVGPGYIHRDLQILARRLKEHGEFDKRRLARMVRYLKGTRSYGVLLKKPRGSKNDTVQLELFSYTDFGTCKGDPDGDDLQAHIGRWSAICLLQPATRGPVH